MFRRSRKSRFQARTRRKYGRSSVASAKIVGGEIKIKSDSLPSSYTSDGTGLKFQDGSILRADVVRFATGFALNMRDQASSLFSRNIAEKDQ
jgi:hypothetical protein